MDHEAPLVAHAMDREVPVDLHEETSLDAFPLVHVGVRNLEGPVDLKIDEGVHTVVRQDLDPYVLLVS